MAGRLAVEDWPQTGSDPGGRPLVLVHGLATSRWIWDLVAPPLCARRPVVTLDLPGFGNSAAAGPGFDLDRVAARVARGLAARGVRGPFDLVGHSLGAAVTVALAVAHPRSVQRLVLVAPAGMGVTPTVLAAALAAGAAPVLTLRRRLGPLADFAWGRRLLLIGAAADGAALAPSVARRMIGASARARRTPEALATVAEGHLPALLSAAACPVGAIWGERDRTIPASRARALLRVRPDAEIELIAGVGHVPMLEAPEAFVAALERLLGRLPQAGE